MSVRGLGFLPDPREVVEAQLVAYHARELYGAAVGLPSVFSWRAYVETVPDQMSTSSCVGQAFANALHLHGLIRGEAMPRPSAKAIYDFARMLDTGITHPLFDGGSRPSMALNGMRDYGLVAEERWPLTEANVNDKPAWDVFRHALSATLDQHYRIASGRGAGQLIREALASRYLPVFAMDVDAAFMDHDGRDVYRGLAGPVVGRHMQAIVGWDGSRFEVIGSWGTGWADGGFVMLSEDFIESAACDSFIVPTLSPVVS